MHACLRNHSLFSAFGLHRWDGSYFMEELYRLILSGVVSFTTAMFWTPLAHRLLAWKCTVGSRWWLSAFVSSLYVHCYYCASSLAACVWFCWGLFLLSCSVCMFFPCVYCFFSYRNGAHNHMHFLASDPLAIICAYFVPLAQGNAHACSCVAWRAFSCHRQICRDSSSHACYIPPACNPFFEKDYNNLLICNSSRVHQVDELALTLCTLKKKRMYQPIGSLLRWMYRVNGSMLYWTASAIIKRRD